MKRKDVQADTKDIGNCERKERDLDVDEQRSLVFEGRNERRAQSERVVPREHVARQVIERLLFGCGCHTRLK